MSKLHHVEIRSPEGKGYNSSVLLDGEEIHATKVVVTLEPRDMVKVELTIHATIDIDGQAEVERHIGHVVLREGDGNRKLLVSEGTVE